MPYRINGFTIRFKHLKWNLISLNAAMNLPVTVSKAPTNPDFLIEEV